VADVLSVVGQLLPVGLAAAISTVPISLMIVILLSRRRSVAALPFAIGYVFGTAAVVVVAAYASQLLPDPSRRQPVAAVGVLEIILGTGLVVLGIIRARRRPDLGAPPSRLAAIASSMITTIGPVKALGLGLLLGFRPKSVLLAGVVGLQLASLKPGPELVGVILGYTLIATSTVLVPVVLTIISPKRMEPRLTSSSELLTTHGPLISAVVLVMVGVVVIGVGLQDLV
jgi:Sap, sulfolipid-1-addressing protein